MDETNKWYSEDKEASHFSMITIYLVCGCSSAHNHPCCCSSCRVGFCSSHLTFCFFWVAEGKRGHIKMLLKYTRLYLCPRHDVFSGFKKD